MANKNTLILCLFVVLLIFLAGTGEARNHHTKKKHATKYCIEKWETVCVIEDDCQEKCFRNHGRKAIPICLVQEGPTGGDLCECKYHC
ncbi:hypothetical protein MKW94_009097 [Papaver nudicaule]|uniref:Uncharacterized protein n=1 Tax=Papaver nudicaule TaxID=74823 RepID=A0AA41SDL4_PAPNU|nr:hypothetical protein [Papaver nudicaule]